MQDSPDIVGFALPFCVRITQLMHMIRNMYISLNNSFSRPRLTLHIVHMPTWLFVPTQTLRKYTFCIFRTYTAYLRYALGLSLQNLYKTCRDIHSARHGHGLPWPCRVTFKTFLSRPRPKLYFLSWRLHYWQLDKKYCYIFLRIDRWQHMLLQQRLPQNLPASGQLLVLGNSPTVLYQTKSTQTLVMLQHIACLKTM